MVVREACVGDDEGEVLRQLEMVNWLLETPIKAHTQQSSWNSRLTINIGAFSFSLLQLV